MKEGQTLYRDLRLCGGEEDYRIRLAYVEACRRAGQTPSTAAYARWREQVDDALLSQALGRIQASPQNGRKCVAVQEGAEPAAHGSLSAAVESLVSPWPGRACTISLRGGSLVVEWESAGGPGRAEVHALNARGLRAAKASTMAKPACRAAIKGPL